jgi:phosphatidate cytidylyltransferase
VNGTAGPGPAEQPRGTSDLRVRTLSAAVLMLAAAAVVWAGGFIFAVAAGLAAGLILYEWMAMAGPLTSRVAGRASIALVALSVAASYRDPLAAAAALAAVGIGVGLFGAVDRPMRWLGAGILYAGLPGIAAVALRGTAPAFSLSNGLAALAFVFLVVWATDTAAYFAGRRIGGPKLAPRFSPKKTWSGAIGGVLAALATGAIAGSLLDDPTPMALGLVAVALSVVSQAGDLGESAMKRHFGVKDSGRLIPGHGGIMDRVDGLVVALVLAAIIGLVRTSGTNAADGLLIW